MAALYTTSVSATAGRDGRIVSDDGQFDAALSMPRELGGEGRPGTNPEQLLAAGYASCFVSALMLVARRRRLDPGPVTITATVSLSKEGERFVLGAAIQAAIPGMPADQARELVQAAHEVCPYSYLTRGNIDVPLSVA
jgi:osmotically inducible protein OsmC